MKNNMLMSKKRQKNTSKKSRKKYKKTLASRVKQKNNRKKLLLSRERHANSRKIRKKKLLPIKRQTKSKKKSKKKNIPPSRTTKAYVDSFNVACPHLLTILLNYKYRYQIQRIYINKPADRAKWRKLFGKSLFNTTRRGRVCPLYEAYIVECPALNITIPLKVFSASKKSFTMEFAGLKSYDKKSERRREILRDLLDDFQDCYIHRIDIAIDFHNRMPHKVHQALLRTRKVELCENTRYYKTKKEGKTNHRMNILMYDKRKKEGIKLSNKLLRLEFQFKFPYFKHLRVCEIPKAIKKMKASIKEATTLNIEINDDLIS